MLKKSVATLTESNVSLENENHIVKQQYAMSCEELHVMKHNFYILNQDLTKEKAECYQLKKEKKRLNY